MLAIGVPAGTAFLERRRARGPRAAAGQSLARVMISLRTRGERPYVFAACHMARGEGAPKPAVLLPEHLYAAVVLAVLHTVIALVASCHSVPPLTRVHTDFNGKRRTVFRGFHKSKKKAKTRMITRNRGGPCRTEYAQWATANLARVIVWPQPLQIWQ